MRSELHRDVPRRLFIARASWAPPEVQNVVSITAMSSLLLTLGEEETFWLPPLGKQFAKARAEFFNSGNQVVIRLITALRMSYEESYAKAFPLTKCFQAGKIQK
jgi:hypothetical protein